MWFQPVPHFSFAVFSRAEQKQLKIQLSLSSFTTMNRLAHKWHITIAVPVKLWCHLFIKRCRISWSSTRRLLTTRSVASTKFYKRLDLFCIFTSFEPSDFLMNSRINVITCLMQALHFLRFIWGNSLQILMYETMIYLSWKDQIILGHLPALHLYS